MKQVGVHIRLTHSLTDLVQKAVRLGVPFFQCFLILQETGKFIEMDESDVREFLRMRMTHFQTAYLHGSYWINLASVKNREHKIFKREIELAKKLAFTHLILHPGAPSGGSKRQGIEGMARILNEVLAYENSVQIVLENSAHGKTSIGGDLHDFKLLKSLLNHPEKVKFCIDTAHAYVYGYDIMHENGRQNFITVLEDSLGADSIALIHLNDSFGKCGSKIDRHAAVGQGSLGIEPLKSLLQHTLLAHKPLLMELPEMNEEEEKKIIAEVSAW